MTCPVAIVQRGGGAPLVSPGMSHDVYHFEMALDFTPPSPSARVISPWMHRSLPVGRRALGLAPVGAYWIALVGLCLLATLVQGGPVHGQGGEVVAQRTGRAAIEADIRARYPWLRKLSDSRVIVSLYARRIELERSIERVQKKLDALPHPDRTVISGRPWHRR